MYQESLSQINPIESERSSLFRGKMGKWLCRGCRQRGSMGGSTPYPILRKRREEVFAGDWLRREGCSTSLQHPCAPAASHTSAEPSQGVKGVEQLRFDTSSNAPSNMCVGRLSQAKKTTQAYDLGEGRRKPSP